MPMIGSGSEWDYSFYAEWWFSVGPQTKTCDVSAFIPLPMRDIDVRGNPAYYEIRDSSTSPVRATPTVDQWENRAKWVSLGTHGINGGKIVIRLRNQGTDPDKEHLAIAAVRVVCHG